MYAVVLVVEYMVLSSSVCTQCTAQCVPYLIDIDSVYRGYTVVLANRDVCSEEYMP